MFKKRIATSFGLLLALFAVTCTGCLTEPKDGQNIVGRFIPFRATGYFPSIWETQPDIVLQAYNYTTQKWEGVATVWFMGSPRYVNGYWYYPWRNDAVYLGVAKYWQYDPATGLWRAKFRAYDRANGFALPPSDEATLQPLSNTDHVRLYAYF